MHQPVFMIGNNEGNAQSVQTGYISSLYGRENLFPFQSLIISLNAAGGCSGSPLFNAEGEAIGLIYGGGTGTRALAMPIEYITDALKVIVENRLPKRKTTHANFALINASDARRYMRAPQEIEGYVKKFPDGRNRLLIVRNLFPGAGQNSPLKRNDIILKVNGKFVGPSLLILDRALHQGKKETAQFKILRRPDPTPGKPQSKMEHMDITVPLYIAIDHATRMIEYGGSTFCQPNDYTRLTSGDLGENGQGVYCGSYFCPGCISAKMPKIDMAGVPIVWQLKSISRFPIRTLNDLLKAIPQLREERYVTMNIVAPLNYFPFNNLLVNSPFRGDIFIDLYEHDIARYYKWNQEQRQWDSTVIGDKAQALALTESENTAKPTAG